MNIMSGLSEPDARDPSTDGVILILISVKSTVDKICVGGIHASAPMNYEKEPTKRILQWLEY